MRLYPVNRWVSEGQVEYLSPISYACPVYPRHVASRTGRQTETFIRLQVVPSTAGITLILSLTGACTGQTVRVTAGAEERQENKKRKPEFHLDKMRPRLTLVTGTDGTQGGGEEHVADVGGVGGGAEGTGDSAVLVY